MQSMKASAIFRSPAAWGFSAMALATIVAVLLAYLYYNPPGRNQIVSFYTDDAASLRTGEEVRVSGIKVGKVSNLRLESNQVLVTAEISDDVFVGDQSQIDVRMLTVVGGYYVNLASAGSTPLGTNPIPLQRVNMPYSLIRALTDSTKITDNVQTAPVNESLNQIAQGLSGTNVQVVATTIDAGNALMKTVERQRGQVSKILGLTDEYIRALSKYRDKFEQLVRKVSILTQTLVIYNRGFANTLQGLGDVSLALKPIGDFYIAHEAEFTEKVRNFLDQGRQFVERNGVTIRLLKRMQNTFDRVLNAQNSEPALLATDLCVPTPGSPC
ncbi:mammalian cell entry protein [Mycolicibacterium mucogenicum]|uniref:Mammalian cell entry protein n=1 Tax=Mycolicibacterium mucogenicum TaxID=56689 RepID=A0A1A3H2H5_MYCMU|nr:MlaD family protein [Mycolicibacterium mucogenicum]OBJ42492.1 mammalian cell entry protein [Mycolicibacterium mucogenicum]